VVPYTRPEAGRYSGRTTVGDRGKARASALALCGRVPPESPVVNIRRVEHDHACVVTRLQRRRRNTAIGTDYGQDVRSVDDRRAPATGADRDRARA
jgi:hypothetical protein